jgi:hypothetical protein
MLRRLALQTVTLLVAIGAAPDAMATVYPHAACAADGDVARPVMTTRYLYVGGDSVGHVICPVIKDSVGTGISALTLDVDGPVSCRLYGPGPSLAASNESGRRTITFEHLLTYYQDQVSVYGDYFVHCTLGPGAKLFSYEVIE